MVSDTVWNREIFEGFQSLLHEKLGSSYPVKVRKPEEDFKVESYPCVILQITSSLFNADRYYKQDFYTVSEDRSKFVGVIDEPPLTYDINLQMDFYAEKASDLDTMTIKWLSFFRRDFNLKVKTTGGELSDIHVMPDGTVKRMDELNGSDRLFRNCFNYKVYGRIFEHSTMEEVPLLRGVIPSIKKL